MNWSIAVSACLGLDLAAQILFVPGPGSDLIQMMAIKRYIDHFGLPEAILFQK
jgi:hypothetical protein